VWLLAVDRCGRDAFLYGLTELGVQQESSRHGHARMLRALDVMLVVASDSLPDGRHMVDCGVN